MFVPPRPSPQLQARPSVILLMTLLGGMSVVAATASPREVSSRSGPERDFRLFVGLDVKVAMEENYALVEGYVNNRVRTDLTSGLLSLRNIDDIRFAYETKLSRSPLQIDNVQTEQIEGTVKAAMDAMRNQAALTSFTQDRGEALQANLEWLSVGLDPNDQESVSAVMQAQDARDSFQMDAAKITDEDDYTDQVKRTETDEPTALSITAQISSPNPIADAYIIGVARISSDKSVGDDVLFFKEAGRLDSKPKQIQIIREGLPKEFKVLDVRMHIYRNGQELATNQSQKQFALTRAEAIEFLALLRTSENRGKTLPPEPVWALAPPQLFAEKQSDEFDYPLTIKVDERGQVVAIDENTIATPAVRAVVEELFFLPALEAGVPVAGVANINLKDFYR